MNDSGSTLPIAGSATTRRNLRICTWESIFATPIVFIAVPGNFVMGALVTQVFEIDKALYGWIVSLPAWFNGFQILLIPLLSRHISARGLNLGFAWAQAVIWGLLTAVLPFIPSSNAELATRILFVALALSSLTGSICGVGWTSWVQEWIPSRLRGKYFGRRNRIVGLATIAFLLVVGELIASLGGSVVAYAMVFGLATVFRFVSVFLQYGIKTETPQRAGSTEGTWWSQMESILKNRMFLRFVGFGAYVGFWLSFIGPFAPIYMYDHLDLTVPQVTRLTIIASLSGAIALPLWGQIMDRYGCKAAIITSLVLWETSNYLWIVLTPRLTWMLIPMWFWGGFVSGGFLLGTFTMLLKLLSRSTKTIGISLNLTVTSIAAGIAPILAGVLFDWFGGGPNEVLIYRIAFGLKSSAVLISIAWLIRIVEPQSVELRHIFGSMRTFRQTLLVDGLAFFANVNFVRHPTRMLRRKARAPGTRVK